ncbi:crossover junction endonuclease eme1b [Phtheirospermum japonicum]|uniref:Crossover junction endonuclease eme1b n=1 Tax=Phtheirospermum japonicum TaxID=374723 RepID=A0A830CDJ1_9LAMI|nr:crossover junction endonuclease eme1b [Phtheirospermum japonicum]
MSQPIPVDILSDSDSDPGGYRRRDPRNDAIDLTTPPLFLQSKKKQRIESISNPSDPTVFIIDDDPTPCKKTVASTPSFVAETPFSDASIVKCSTRKRSISGESLATEQLVVEDTPMSEHLNAKVSLTKRDTGVLNIDYSSLMSKHNSADINGPICVDSDNESENVGVFGALELDGNVFAAKLTDESESESRLLEPSFSLGTSFQLHKKQLQKPATVYMLEGCFRSGVLEDGLSEACDDTEDEASKIDPVGQIPSQQNKSGCHMKKKKKADETMKPKRTSKEERLRMMEERKKLKEQEKLLKAASKAEAAELKKSQKEMQKWEKGKYALKSIVAEIDKRVVELGSIGEKGLSYRITSNPVERSIVWNMIVPEEISMIASERIEVSYVLIIYEAEEFCNLVTNDSLKDHVQSVQNRYPHHTICYVTNRLMAYINKREQAQYKNPANNTGWKRPAIEEVLTKLATHYFRVHSRQCVDEAELAEHVAGLTCSLASCQFRLKALVAIPKVQPRFAIAIWKKYPTMKSLLRVYMDPTKSVHEKEFLLKDLNTEGLLGDDRRLGEICSKRIYRILMAQCGSIKTDDVENGADFFSHRST